MRFEEQLGEWNGWDLVDTTCFQFYNFTFSKDFGPWKVGHIAKSLVFTLDKSTIEEYDDDGKVVASCKFWIIPLAN